MPITPDVSPVTSPAKLADRLQRLDRETRGLAVRNEPLEFVKQIFPGFYDIKVDVGSVTYTLAPDLKSTDVVVTPVLDPTNAFIVVQTYASVGGPNGLLANVRLVTSTTFTVNVAAGHVYSGSTAYDYRLDWLAVHLTT